MGGGRWNPDDWKTYTTKSDYAKKSTTQIYTSTAGCPLSPCSRGA